MAGEWVETSLGDIVDIKHGFAFKGAFFRDEPPGDILLTPGNFAVGGGFKADKFKYYDGPIPDEFVMREGDLVVTMTDLSKNADTLGYPAVIPSNSEGRRYLHNQRLGKVLAKDKDAIDFLYLHYLMCSKEYRHEVVAGATGTTVKHTSPERIKRFRFRLPSLEEQRTIAHILGTMDDKIELNRRMNETLEEMARAIFKSWFVDFDPVRAKAEGRDPGLPKHIADLYSDRFEDSELGKIPAGWRVEPIGEVVKVVGGGTPSTKEPAFWDGGTHCWATPKDLSKLQDPILLDTERKVTDAGLAKISSGLLPVGTVLLSSRAPVGYLAVARVPVSVNQGFIAMVCEGPLTNNYVLHWALSNMEQIEGRASGTTFQEISKKNFRPMLAMVPTRAVLSAFEAQVATLYDKVTANLQHSRTLAAMRDALLPRLISGELRVGEAEAFVRGAAGESREALAER
jgi:type I restriction enzyme, S subunit